MHHCNFTRRCTKKLYFKKRMRQYFSYTFDSIELLCMWLIGIEGLIFVACIVRNIICRVAQYVKVAYFCIGFLRYLHFQIFLEYVKIVYLNTFFFDLILWNWNFILTCIKSFYSFSVLDLAASLKIFISTVVRFCLILHLLSKTFFNTRVLPSIDALRYFTNKTRYFIWESRIRKKNEVSRIQKHVLIVVRN